MAEAENRKQDALSCYQKALEVRPRRDGKPSPDAPDSLVDRTRQLWEELGGTDQGWRDWFSHSETGKTIIVESRATNWEKRNRTLPDFELVDLQGRKWRLADLKGKVSFVNVWATWCGPCHVELPEVQKLQERLKEQPDALVLTLNLDFNIGLVKPFLKQNGYTFPVIPATAYLEKVLPTVSLPLNWVINKDGVVQMEQRGFIQGDPHWLDQVFEVIQKVRVQ